MCGATLWTGASASEMIGFRSFDLSALLQQESDDLPGPPIDPVRLSERRKAPGVQAAEDAGRWSDDGGSGEHRAVARHPLPR